MTTSHAAPKELDAREQWTRDRLHAEAAAPPFSFVYDGRPSSSVLAVWERTTETTQLDETRIRHTQRWRDPSSGMVVECVGTEYLHHPAVEWTVWFRNEGDQPAAVLEDALAIDADVVRAPEGEFVLHYHMGDYNTPDGYEPHEEALRPSTTRTFAPLGGRGSNREFPYYNLEMPGEGLIVAIGWPGQWHLDWQRDAERGLRIRAGQEGVHLSLAPGESIRTPSIALLFWRGDDRIRAQNLWRRWMMAHVMPRPGGALPPPMMPAGSNGFFAEMTQANDANQKELIDRYVEEGITPDYWWMDAGWYRCLDGPGPWFWPKTGTWEVDRERFPGGLRSITDHAHAHGIKSLVWFEPERVAQGTWLADERPQWLLTPAEEPPLDDAEVREAKEWDGFRLLDLGNGEALQWLTDHIDGLLKDEGIDLYRQDFNFDPLPYWQANDTPERRGARENHHVQGYLAYWSALSTRHPDMLIDSCASGGRRNDLESMRLAVPLHKTDYNYADLPVKQAFHHSLFSWIPYFGAPVVPGDKIDVYTFRSAMCPCTVIGFDARRTDLDYALLRRLIAEWRAVAYCYYGDYYPLTPYSRDEDQWMAWQFDLPESGEGLVQAFRRPDTAADTVTFTLCGLTPDTRYEIKDYDEQQTRSATGSELMNEGLTISRAELPGSATIAYRVARDGGA